LLRALCGNGLDKQNTRTTQTKEILMTNISRSILAVLIVASLTVALTGCPKEGPMERTGKEIDKAAEKAGEKVDKAVEKTGEKVEKAGEKIKDSVK
jgi:hyperosmotically inducible protein